jgi:DNA-binding transcriptional MerR regulator
VAWSTREIAELAGTSLRAVRHYHDVGLLDEPARHFNGYKQYRVAHLIRIMRIKRLSDLGFSLPQIAAMGDVRDHPAEALRPIDAELAATIKGLQRARVELGLILHQAAPAGSPSEFALGTVEADLSDADRSIIVMMTRVLGSLGLQTWVGMLRDLPADPVASEFDHLPADAGDSTRQDVAERLVSYVRALDARNAERLNDKTAAPRGSRLAEQTVDKAVNDVYNAAQLDVLRRLQSLLDGKHGTDRT